MSIRFIAELGSCHLGKFSRIIEAIDRCKKAGIDALKLQLFPDEEKYTKTGNVFLPADMFMEAFVYGEKKGLPVSASAFEYSNLMILKFIQPRFIKFAYSKKEQRDWIVQCLTETKSEIIVSCDGMSIDSLPKSVTKLYCIPEYPVRYEIAWDEIFPRFDGFSDHTLGIRQTRKAIQAGAKVIEKHIRLGYEDETQCPDGRFSVLLEDFAQLKNQEGSQIETI